MPSHFERIEELRGEADDLSKHLSGVGAAEMPDVLREPARQFKVRIDRFITYLEGELKVEMGRLQDSIEGRKIVNKVRERSLLEALESSRQEKARLRGHISSLKNTICALQLEKSELERKLRGG